MSSGVVHPLVGLLRHGDSRVISSALKTLGNFVSGDDIQTQVSHRLRILLFSSSCIGWIRRCRATAAWLFRRSFFSSFCECWEHGNSRNQKIDLNDVRSLLGEKRRKSKQRVAYVCCYPCFLLHFCFFISRPPPLFTLSNLVFFVHFLSQAVLGAGVLPHLDVLLTHEKKAIRKVGRIVNVFHRVEIKVHHRKGMARVASGLSRRAGVCWMKSRTFIRYYTPLAKTTQYHTRVLLF